VGKFGFLRERIENVNVRLAGTTDLFSEGTVLCASFNAG
jgi:hypothetical protein